MADADEDEDGDDDDDDADDGICCPFRLAFMVAFPFDDRFDEASKC